MLSFPSSPASPASPAPPAPWRTLFRWGFPVPALLLGPLALFVPAAATPAHLPVDPAGSPAVLAAALEAPTEDLVIRVRDGSRVERGITQAQVTLFRPGSGDPGARRVAERRTGSDGQVTFRDLSAGAYVLRVEAPGFESAEQEVDVPGTGVIDMVLGPRPLTIDEVIGTASPLRSGVTYAAARSYDREALTRRLDASIGSMLDGEPGVAMRSLGAAPTRPVIRGFDGDRILVLENGERMGDVGESAADHAVALDPAAIERVEIVRGPASLLYGSGALGGVVNLTTRDLPRSWSRGWEGAVMTQAATMNRAGSGSGTLIYGTQDWASTFRLSGRQTGDLHTPDGRIPDTALSSLDGSAGFVRQWSEVRVGISGSFVDRKYGIPEAWEDPAEEVFLTMERQSLQARLDWEPERAGLFRGLEVRTFASRYFQQEIEREMADDGSLDEDVELEYDALSASATATLRHGPIGVFGEGAVGVAVRARQMDIGGDEAFFPGIDERSIGIFTFQEASLTRDLSFQLGGRLESNWNDARPNHRFPTADQSRNSTAISGSMGLNWRPGAGWEMGAQLARAHRVPIAEELFANGPHLAAGVFEIGSEGLEDEVSHGLDIFVRRQLGRGSVEVAGFANWIGDYVAFQPLGRIDEESGFPVFRYEGTDARMVGAEVTAELLLADIWRLGGGLDYVRGQRMAGAKDPLPAIPPLRARLQLQADPGRWWAGSTFRAAATQDRVAPDEPATAGYVLLDAQGGVRLDPRGSHSVLLRVDNVLNESYRDHLSRLPGRELLMPGRNVSLTYRWRF
ncbi:MAG: TonB-dependent receptor [Gemmatimonadales bacterium]|nr:MAG: TonB-dependent receptor [Gemmatimonadales bacterium]